MTMTDTTVLRAIAERATPLPWCADPFQPEYPGDGVPIIGLRLNDDGKPMATPTNGIVAAACLLPTEIDALDACRAEANAALIVAAVNALPALLDHIDAQARALEEARAALAPFAKLAGTWTVETAPGLLMLSNGERMCGIEADAFRRARAASQSLARQEGVEG